MTNITKPMTMRDAFLDTLYQAMAKDDRIFFLSADFGAPALDKMRENMPERFLNVGIAEQNLINVASGLSLEGHIVFAYAIAPFITMRCYEQIRINLALLSEVRKLNVNLVGVGAGYSYVVSGPTHQCLEDLSVMRSLPNMQVYSPADHYNASALVDQCIGVDGVKYLRFDVQPLPVLYADTPLDVAKGFHVHAEGGKRCLIATGYMVHTALAVAARLREQGEQVGVINLFNLGRFDANAFAETLRPYQQLITLEEGVHGKGGLDALISSFAIQHHLPAPVLTIGVEGGYRFELGDRQSLHENVGIGVNAVFERVGVL